MTHYLRGIQQISLAISQTPCDHRRNYGRSDFYPTVNNSIPQARFNLSPLIRLTLLSLYGALTLPLPFLAEVTHAAVAPWVLWVGIGLGAIAIYGALSERVLVDDQGLRLAYAPWFPKKGWQLDWQNMTALKPRSTGQGGLVYYFLDKEGKGYLLPMRVAGFARLVDRVERETDLNMRDVRPLSQPWMYFILLGFTALLMLMDGWTIATALSQTALNP